MLLQIFYLLQTWKKKKKHKTMTDMALTPSFKSGKENIYIPKIVEL